MKNIVLGVSLVALTLASVNVPIAVYADGNNGNIGTANKTSASSAAATKKATEAPQSKKGADPVSKTADGADYSSNAGNKAANADIALNAASLAVSALSLLAKFGTITSNLLSVAVPVWGENSWFNIWVAFNPFSTFITLGHAAVNKWMRDATNITASFTGAEGFVTDKWVGPHPRNKTTAIMGDISVTSEKFDALAFDPKEYEGMKDADKASARQLMDYRSEQLIQDQRSLSNVATAQWGILYRAQQRSIKGLASALELKSQLAALGEIEKKISADYKNKPSALNTVASRRALYDALLLLKMNVMAARTKLRSETLELDFKPMTREPEIMEEEPPAPQNVPAGPPLSPKKTQ